MIEIVKKIKKCFQDGGKLIFLGNGGSMAESSHAAAEFINLGLPAISLSDPAIITAISNDHSYFEVFYRWVQAIAKKGDLVIGISSSGNSDNVNNVFRFPIEGVEYIDFPRTGKTTSEVQENQLRLIHRVYEVFK